VITVWLITAGGALLVLAVLVDMFHTLVNPGRQGFLSQKMHAAIWRMSRRSALSGPLAMIGVLGVWGLLAVLGWALVYWPHMPEGFAFPDGSSAARDPAFLDAVYLSLVTISTLGFGDVFPAAGWLRVVNPLEAVFGFALLTVAVSWVLQVYPALTRRRILALRLTALERAGVLDELPNLDASTASDLLHGLATDIIGARVDLSDYRETYYFRENDREAALAATLGFAVDLGAAATASPQAGVRLAGEVLLISLADFASVLDSTFLRPHGSSADPIASYAEDHRHGQA